MYIPINCRGTITEMNPQVMGILNVTPDSFYDGGKYKSDSSFLKQTEKMLLEGASIIDIGAASSKPSSEMVSEAEELSRITPIVEQIIKVFPEIILSVDTFRSQVATECVYRGAAIINDISAGRLDEKMMKTVADLQVPYIMMHMHGTPQTMQSLTNYNDIIKEIIFYFSERINVARSYGISDLIIDPGFGFSKTIEQNFIILKHLEQFQMLNLPILAGLSRKSTIYKTLKLTAEDALNGTTVLNTIALQKGANILRVHDVKEAVDCIKLVSCLSSE